MAVAVKLEGRRVVGRAGDWRARIRMTRGMVWRWRSEGGMVVGFSSVVCSWLGQSPGGESEFSRSGAWVRVLVEIAWAKST